MNKSEKEWKRELSPEQYHVLRERGTEAPFSGEYVKANKKGKYVCVACGNELFSSDTKFESSCGWPSFYDAKKDAVEFRKDSSHGMERTEVICKKCGGHLGHIFDDGPNPTGKRFCINSVALDFRETKMNEKATFGAGCFWHVEEEFRKIKGVIKTTVGYMGGKLENPSYEDVCTDKTGHVEVCQVEFDPDIVSYNELLDAFWNMHDPTQFNRQGPDVGSQYKSVIFYHDDRQKRLATVSKEEKQKELGGNVVTEVIPAKEFYEAEEYHQKYLMKRGKNTCLF